MIGVILATADEARPLLGKLNAQKLGDNPFPLYRFAADQKRPGGMLLLCGMGPIAAARAAEYLIVERGATTIINMGIAGCLRNNYPLGTLLGISQAIAGDDNGDDNGDNNQDNYHEDNRSDQRTANPNAAVAYCPCHHDIWQDLPQARLASVAEPVFCPMRKTQLAQHAELVDMEGFSIARVCQQHGVRCYLLKGVTDSADAEGKKHLHQNLSSVSAALADTLITALARLPQLGHQSWVMISRLVKIEHSIFSLPLLFAGAWLGAGGTFPSFRFLLFIALAGVGARTFGMAMNRIFDRSFDALNKRTAARELASGRISLTRVYAIAGAGLMLYLLSCAALSPLCLMLSPIPAAVLLTYSLLKRFTSWCHFGIGASLALAPLAAFIAAANTLAFSQEVLLLSLFTFCWISGFDIIYAMQDRQSDREIGIYSVPVRLGNRGSQLIAAALHLVAIGAIVWLWRQVGGGAISGGALAISIMAFILGNVPQIPIPLRFFPISAVASVAGAIVPLLGELR